MHGDAVGSPMSVRRGVPRRAVRTGLGKRRREARWCRSAQGLDGSKRERVGMSEEGAGMGRD